LTARQVGKTTTASLRIRAVRAEMLPVDGCEMDTQTLKRLVSLDTYQRYARTKQRRASLQHEDSINSIKS
jgi:predicted AAA+ superfamily ATPase